MSILTIFDGYAHYKLIDDATRQEIQSWVWVDDEELEYARASLVIGVPDVNVKVTAVSVNHAACEIHVNEPSVRQIRLVELRPHYADRIPEPCDECCDGEACRRIGQCMRFKCAFGEVDKP